MQPQVSVVVPTYNRARLAHRAVQSVLAQDFEGFEIIVVDDASTDDTATVLGAIADPRFRYVRLPTNVGAGLARNHGMALAAGAFVAFLDSDDIWLPRKLSTQLAAVLRAANPKRAFCFSRFEFHTGDLRKIRPLRGPGPGEDVAEYLFCNAGTIHTSTILAARGICEVVAFSNATGGEDTEFTIDASRAGAEFLYVDEALSVYHSDRRSDRMSLKWDHRLLVDLQRRLAARVSVRATRGFAATTVAPYLIETRKLGNRLTASRLITVALLTGALSGRAAKNVLAMLLLPVAAHVLLQRIKTLWTARRELAAAQVAT